jgi:predicted DNA-binding transcriptional regulator AlpA
MTNAYLEEILPEKQAAKECGFSVDTLRRRNAAGEGPKRIRLSERRWGYKRRHLHEWHEANAVEGPSK